MTAHEMSGSASANSSTNSTLSGKDNNISDNTSIVSGTSLSTSVEKLNLHKTNKNGEAKGATMADATMENGHQLSTNVNKPDLKSRERVKSFASTTVHAGSTSGSNIKLHPVSLKTNTLVKTNGGFKLK